MLFGPLISNITTNVIILIFFIVWHLEMSYTAMPRRWGVMATIMLTNITAFLINTWYFSVAPFAAKFFDVDESEFDLLILVNLLILPPFMLVAVFVAERCGLKVILNFSVILASMQFLAFYSNLTPGRVLTFNLNHFTFLCRLIFSLFFNFHI